jgi:hypothetical protein
MKNLLYLFLAMLVLAACGGGKSDNTDGSDSLSDSILDSTLLADGEDSLMNEMPVSKAIDGVFYDFIATFCQNSRYQKKRIQFPLLRTVNGEEENIDEKDWRFSKLHFSSDAYTVFFSSFKEMELEKSKDVEKVTVQWFEMEKDRASNYNFEKIEGQWMLTSIDEHSIDQDPDSDFLHFYSMFAADPSYQAEHLAESISYDGLDPNDDDEFDAHFVKNHKISAANWSENLIPILPSQDFSNINFGQDLDNSSSERMVSLEAPGSGFTSRIYFRRSEDTWQLYKIENY